MTEHDPHRHEQTHHAPGDAHRPGAGEGHGHVERPAGHGPDYAGQHQGAYSAEPPAAGYAEYDELVVHTAAEQQLARLARLRHIVYFIASMIAGLILFRFILLMLGANPANLFASTIYTLSFPFVAPFLGIFGNEPQYGRSILEIADLLAIAVYYLAAWAIVKALALIYAPPDPTGHTYDLF